MPALTKKARLCDPAYDHSQESVLCFQEHSIVMFVFLNNLEFLLNVEEYRNIHIYMET